MNVFHLKSFHPFLLLDELDAKICLLFYVLLLEIINHSCLVEELTVTLQHLTRKKQTVTLLHFTLNNNSATRLLFFLLLDTNHFWVTESITDRHPFKVDLHFSSGVVFVDVIGNGGDVLPCIRLHRNKVMSSSYTNIFTTIIVHMFFFFLDQINLSSGVELVGLILRKHLEELC